MNCMWLCIKGARFLSLPSFSRLPVVHITFWCNAYSIINVFSFSDIFVKIQQYLEPESIFLSDEKEFPSSSGNHLWPTVGLNFCARNE